MIFRIMSVDSVNIILCVMSVMQIVSFSEKIMLFGWFFMFVIGFGWVISDEVMDKMFFLSWIVLV